MRGTHIQWHLKYDVEDVIPLFLNPDWGEESTMAFRPTGAAGLCLPLDNLLGYDVPTTRRLLNLALLLYSEVLTNDSWLMTNGSLQAILGAPDGKELVTSGGLVLGLRDTIGSYEAFRADCQAKKMTGFCATPAFAAMLDTLPTDGLLRFPMEAVKQTYGDLSGRMLSEDVLRGVGVPDADIAETVRLMGLPDAEPTNSYVVDHVCTQLSPSGADLVLLAFRSPYQVTLPVAIGSGIIGPPGWLGGRFLDAIHGRTTATLETSPTSTSAAHQVQISDPLVAWLLSDDVLSSLTAEEVAFARSQTTNRQAYLATLAAYLRAPSANTWQPLVPSLEAYLTGAAAEIFRRRSVEPDSDAVVIVKGGNAITIEYPGDTVELRDCPPQQTNVSPLTLVGKTVTVPEAS